MSILTSFDFEGVPLAVEFIARDDMVAPGVCCYDHKFVGDKTKDLGIIHIDPDCRTPLQRVVNGDRTVEGYVSGKGSLTIIKPNGDKQVYQVGENPEKPFAVDVKVGDLMQWVADSDSELIASEVCIPPYKPGRFEDIVEV